MDLERPRPEAPVSWSGQFACIFAGIGATILDLELLVYSGERFGMNSLQTSPATLSLLILELPTCGEQGLDQSEDHSRGSHAEYLAPFMVSSPKVNGETSRLSGRVIAQYFKEQGFSPTLLCSSQELSSALEVLPSSDVFSFEADGTNPDSSLSLGVTLQIQSVIQKKNPNLIFLVGSATSDEMLRDFLPVQDSQKIFFLSPALSLSEMSEVLALALRERVSQSVAEEDPVFFANLGVMDSFNDHDYLLPFREEPFKN